MTRLTVVISVLCALYSPALAEEPAEQHKTADEFTALFSDVSVLSSSQSQIDRLIQHFGYGGMMKLLKLKQSQLVMEQSPQSTKIGRVDPSPASP